MFGQASVFFPKNEYKNTAGHLLTGGVHNLYLLNRTIIWQAHVSPASLRVSPCQYRRRVDRAKSSTSNNCSGKAYLLYANYNNPILFCKEHFYFLEDDSILFHLFS